MDGSGETAVAAPPAPPAGDYGLLTGNGQISQDLAAVIVYYNRAGRYLDRQVFAPGSVLIFAQPMDTPVGLEMLAVLEIH